MKNAVKSFIGLIIVSVSCGGMSAQAGWSEWFSLKRAKEIVPINNELYQEECGSCHFAYQPGLLPSRSWEKLMGAEALANHFGDNAELDEATRTSLLAILVSASADTAASKRSKKIIASIKEGATPLRITEVPYIVTRHEEIPENLVKGNSKVNSLSQCQACHQEIEQGVYDDDTVYIPGHGYW